MDWTPPLEHFEDAAAGVNGQVEALLAAARAELRKLQDFDAELADDHGGTMLAVHAARAVTRHRLRAIARQFTLALAELVPVTDRQRFAAAQRVKTWAAEGQAADPPYLEAEVA